MLDLHASIQSLFAPAQELSQSESRLHVMPALVSLLPFQELGATWLAQRPRALLCDEMRVGKTPACVSAADRMGAKSVLVLCPAIARPGWLREFKRFGNREGYAITSAVNWDLVIIDEGHFCKDFAAARTQATFGIAAGARYAWFVTGTPAPNNRTELWPVLYSFGLIKQDFWHFARTFCVLLQTPFGTKIVGNRKDTDAAFDQLLRPHMLRRTLLEVAPHMPVARWSLLPLEPGPIDVPDRDELMRLAGEEEQQLRDRLHTAQLDLDELDPDAAPNYRRLVGLQKVQPLAELLKAEMRTGLDRVVVFGWHVDVLHALALALKSFGARVVNGSTSDRRREDALAAFAAGKCKVLLCNIKTAGTAIDLSHCDDAVFIEEDWVPANNLQAAYRIVSQFKTRPNRLRTAVLRDTIDEQVVEINASKIKMIAPNFSTTVAYHGTEA